MTHAARSWPAAEQRALEGENDSQDSQARLLFLMHEHGVGVTSSSPIPENWPGSRTREQPPAPTSNLHSETKKQQSQINEIDIASNATNTNPLTNADIEAVIAAASSYNPSRHERSSAPRPSKSSFTWGSSKRSKYHVSSGNEHPSEIDKDNAPSRVPASTAPSKPRTQNMSSQSPTQSNEGRSYEQYGSQASTQDSTADEHRTLHEGDTGYVDLGHTVDAPDTPFTRHDGAEVQDRSQFTSQLASAFTDRFAPETPAVFAKPFLNGGNVQLMGGTQLFDQTQPTSGLRKPSPTSSRPSPNIFANNNITSPTHAISSPLKDRGLDDTPLPPFASTSPGLPERSSRPSDGTSTRSPAPIDAISEGDESNDEDRSEAQDLPKPSVYGARNNREPLNEFRPYRKRNSNGGSARNSTQHSVDSDFDRDDAESRRQRARFRKEKASKSFPDISVPSSEKAKVEVPSTNRVKRVLERTVSDRYIDQWHGETVTDNDSTQCTVADSQDAIVSHQPNIDEDDGVTLNQDREFLAQNRNVKSSDREVAHVEEKEMMVPETSPVGTNVEQPRPFRDFTRPTSNASSAPPPLSFPSISLGASEDYPGSLKTTGQPEPSASTENTQRSRRSARGVPVAPESSPSVVLASSQEGVRRPFDRRSQVATPASSAPNPSPSDAPSTSTSSLSVLSATPEFSSSITPDTEPIRHVNQAEKAVTVSSPAAAKRKRRERPTSSLPIPTRSHSVSTDELTVETKRSAARKPTRKSTTLRDFQAKNKLFEGMNFAISFQETQQSHKGKDKSMQKDHVENTIKQNGGKILADGFNVLFKFDRLSTAAHASSTPVLSSSLKLINPENGFTALIADGHSRKVKYMQALALGIPCLAPRWIVTCLAKNEIVDWSSYLLCAGPSVLLSNAIRSRNLTPYDASTAKLAVVIEQRPKLLDESRILIIMKNKNEDKRLPYVFLAQVLGASLVRVHNLDEARAKLRTAEDEDKPFDWVYVDDDLQDARTALFDVAPAKGSIKKRKRASTSTSDEKDDDRPPKRIRALNDELVVQSLILGRLIEEDELGE